ncbi:alpha/beta-hydrolase [Hysterangium stoloniferum]|nr:alpha/beta-hydrolase [Hysterangium stoloniferum]
MAHPILLIIVSLLSLVCALSPYSRPNSFHDSSSRDNDTIPLVIWHGLGDSYSSSGMLEIMDIVRKAHPSIFIHSVYIEEDIEADQKAGWIGNLQLQIPLVAEQLAAIPELQGGFDAIGFSQGGQFLRAFTEIYNSPPVHNLITFGSQHMGIAASAACKPFDVVCYLVQSVISTGVYTEWAQTNVIPAQYFRDSKQLPTYLASNHFLTAINNEIPTSRNATYAKNLASLSNLVLVLFTQDTTVVPKESAWFGSYAPPAEGELTGTDEPTLITMRKQPLYVEDWIGLKTLDEAGKVKFASCEGGHMQLTQACWGLIVNNYLGGTKKVLKNDLTEFMLVQQL